jgi:hypothetical protein
MDRHAARAAVRTVAPAALAAGAFLVLTLSTAGWLGLALLCLALVAGWGATRPPALGADLAPRLLLAAGVLVLAAREATGARWPLVGTGAVLVGLLLSEGLLHRLARPWYRAAHLPVPRRTPAALVGDGTAWLVDSTAVALVGLAGVLAWPAWVTLVPAAAAGLFSAGLAVDGLRRWRTRHRAELAVLRRAVEEHDPRFILYFSAPSGSEYQARMWLPQLERVGEPFLVVLAEAHNLAPVAAATRAPVVLCETFEALDAVLVPGIRAAFYVNNGMKNAHCLRFTRLTHVQLYHGDSDKAVTASPLNAVFDRIFVAGQAAVDRFAAHGVDIARERFRIVGRPQVARIEVGTEHIGRISGRTVLYAPTWVGAHADARYCSLPIATTIVEALLARGVTVIFRPHPYTGRDHRSAGRLREVEELLARDRDRTGREHRWGQISSSRLSLFDCMNLSHAMICDVSSVASEYLYSGKPFAITDMVGAGATFQERFPVARAAYAISGDAGNLSQVLDDLLERDPRRQARQEARAYYLGDFPPERYGETFVTEARRVLAAPVPDRTPSSDG